MKIFNLFSDYLWVLQAYLRGKVLRQKAYRPQSPVSFRAPKAKVDPQRMFMLIRWWKLRPATLGEMATLTVQEMEGVGNSQHRMLYINCPSYKQQS